MVATQAATDKLLPSTAPACRVHTRHECRPVPGRDRRSLLQVRTSPSPGLQTHTHLCTPQALSWPLCLAGTPGQLPGRPNHPMGIPIADWSSLSFGSKHLQPSYIHSLGKIQTFAPNSQHPVHQLSQPSAPTSPVLHTTGTFCTPFCPLLPCSSPSPSTAHLPSICAVFPAPTPWTLSFTSPTAAKSQFA